MVRPLRSLRRLAGRLKRIPWKRETARLFREHEARFGAKPVLMNIGARDGSGHIWGEWARKRLIDVVGFEPDEQEVKRLSALEPYARFHPYALGDRTGTATLYLTESPYCVSCREPDMEVLAPYPVREWLEVLGTSEVQVYRFDELADRGLAGPPGDLLQMDVQGFEYEVLEGMGRYLDGFTYLQLETQFKPIYKGQKLFADVKALLEGRGFILRHLDTYHPFEGEVVEIDVYFCRPIDRAGERERSLINLIERVLKVPPPLRFRDIAWQHVPSSSRKP